MKLGDYLKANDLDSKQVAARLAAAGVTYEQGPRAGQPIDADSIARRVGRTIPKGWRDALGVSVSSVAAPASEPGAPPPGEGADASDGRRREAPPQRPSEAPIQIEDTQGAQRRIAGAYKFVGAALATGTGSEGVAVVWADNSDNIAQLWVEAARDNPWAARFVNMMNAGGIAGDLAASHLYLAGATAYVVGAAIPAGDSLFGKYKQHRVERPTAPEPEPELFTEPAYNGSGNPDDVAATGAVGENRG